MESSSFDATAIVNPYRIFLSELVDELTSEDLKRLKFYLKDFLGAGTIDKIVDVHSCFDILEQKANISQNDLSYLHYILPRIGRLDLVKKVSEFEKKNSTRRPVNSRERNEGLHNSSNSKPNPCMITNSSTKKFLKPTDFKKNIQKLPSENVLNTSYEETNVKLGFEEVQQRKETLLLSASSNDASYSMNSNPSGICYIINNSFSHEVKTQNGKLLDLRKGTEKDVLELQNTFSWLNFKVIIKNNVEACDILKIIKSRQNMSLDCFVCCILSHGFYDGVYGSDGEEVKFEEMIAAINGSSAPWLVEKPKLFFVQACQADEEEKKALYQDSPLSNFRGNQTPNTSVYNRKSLAEDADFCLSVATTPGKFAYRHAIEGSWYIQTLCHILKKEASRLSLTDMLLKLNYMMAEKEDSLPNSNDLAKQMSSMRYITLRMPLRFNPKVQCFEDYFSRMSVNEYSKPSEDIENSDEEHL